MTLTTSKELRTHSALACLSVHNIDEIHKIIDNIYPNGYYQIIEKIGPSLNINNDLDTYFNELKSLQPKLFFKQLNKMFNKLLIILKIFKKAEIVHSDIKCGNFMLRNSIDLRYVYCI